MQLLIPQPILFHPLKHHLGYLKALISHYSGKSADLDALIATLRTMGNSQMDLYTGSLSPEVIAQEVIDILHSINALSPMAYRAYLKEGDGFQIRHLSDGTAWVLRWGELAERYVHIHPGRYALHTVRVKATALKTAVASMIFAQRHGKPQPDLPLMNEVRQQWLNLAPAKSFDADKGVGKLLQLLQ